MIRTESTTDKPEQVQAAQGRANRKPGRGSIAKASACYQYHPDTEYRCQECAMLKKLDGRHGCAWFGPTESVKPSAGSCNYFAHAHPETFHTDVPWLSLFTKEELGYVENPNGFSCKRCEEFLPHASDCKKVDRNSEGDTPGEINPNGCCNLWEADRKRAGKTTPELVKLLGA
jgi:hypothetical protein